MPRKILTIAISLAVLKIAVLLFSLPGVIAGVAETAIGVLVVIAFLSAARRAGDFGRQFWQLLALSFVVWTLAHIPIVYRRDILGNAVSSDYWSVVVLFFVFVIPFGAALFLRERGNERRLYVQELLDFLQLSLLVLSLFLAFAYLPFLQDPTQRIIIEKSFSWHLVRDGALLLGFIARGYLAHARNVRYLFQRMSVYLALYTSGAALYFYGQAHWPNSGKVTDLVSDLVRVAAIALAVTAREPEPEPIEFSVSRPSRLWIQLLLFPALILVMVPRIGVHSALSAALLLVTSILCVCARLYMADREARRFEDSLRASERRFRKLAEGISEGSGDVLFQSLVKHVTEATGAAFALIGELKPGEYGKIQTIAAFGKGNALPNFEYELNGTPCNNVFGKSLCFYPASVAEMFPEDKLLADMGVSAYMGAPLFRTSGEPLGIFVLLHDAAIAEPELAKSILQISAARAARELERERDAEAIRESEAKLALAFKYSPSPIMAGRWGRFETESSGKKEVGWLRLAAVSDSLVSFYGLPRERIIGRAPRELGLFMTADASQDLIRIIEEQRSFKDVELLVANGRGDLRRVLASGQLFEVGSQAYLLAAFDDITEEREARKKLEESEKKYRTLFEEASDILFTCNTAGVFLTLNLAGRKLLGVREEELQSRRFESIADREGVSEARARFDRAVAGEPNEIFEIKVPRSGRSAYLEVSLQSIVDESGTSIIQGIARDITDRKNLEKRIAQSQRLEAVGTFAAGVAHDFNNVLTVIGGYSDLALAAAKDTPLREELEEIKNATSRASALTNQLLMFSRKQVAQPRVLNLNDSVRSMYRMLQRIVGEDIVLELSLDGAGAMVFADATQIDQIIMNLAANARDAMRKGGKLALSTSNLRLLERDPRLDLEAGEYSVITVADTGSGMSEDTMSRLFEPFFTTKEVGKGTGLGLATVYGAVKQANGNITVASELGRGTTFTIYFPAARGAIETRDAGTEQPETNGTETLLLVEDDGALRTLAQKVLDSAGYKVYTCSGVEAAEHLITEVGAQIDLLITDVVMPDGGGVELVNRVSGRFPRLRVLFISGYTDGRIPDGYLAGLGAGFLAKPFQPTQLRAKVREVLDSNLRADAAAAGDGVNPETLH